MTAVVADTSHRSAAGILRAIDDALLGFAGENSYRDDVTLVVCKRNGGAPVRHRRRHRSFETTWTDA